MAADDRSLDMRDVVYWGRLVEPLPLSQVLLVDGSAISAGVLELGAQEITAGIAPSDFSPRVVWEKAVLPRQQVRGVIFRQPSEPAERDALQALMRDASGPEDQFFLDNGDRLAGLVIAVDFGQREPVWRIRTQQGELTVAHQRVAAVAFAGASGPTSTTDARAIRLGMSDGSCLAALRLAEDDRWVSVRLAGGIELRSDRMVFWRELCYVRPARSDVQFLTELNVAGYKHIPYAGLEWRYDLDRNVMGSRLRTVDAWWERGVGMHSTSRLAFDLPADAARLQAELAVDASAGRGGSVVYRVYGQRGNAAWQLLYESSVVRGGEPLQAIDVDVAGVTRIALIVDSADRGDVLDRANWLMARVVRAAYSKAEPEGR